MFAFISHEVIAQVEGKVLDNLLVSHSSPAQLEVDEVESTD